MTARLGHGRAAQTEWRMLLRLGNFALVEASPRTGRTHQVRAHFAATGHPLVGDTEYGAPRQAQAGGVSLMWGESSARGLLEFRASTHGRNNRRASAPRRPLARISERVGARDQRGGQKVDAALRRYL